MTFVDVFELSLGAGKCGGILLERAGAESGVLAVVDGGAHSTLGTGTAHCIGAMVAATGQRGAAPQSRMLNAEALVAPPSALHHRPQPNTLFTA